MHCYIITILSLGAVCVKDPATGSFTMDYPSTQGVSAFLFKSHGEADSALDRLDHGTARKCSIIALLQGAEAAKA